MKTANGIEFRELQSINFDQMPNTLYSGVEKEWSKLGVYFPKEFIDELEYIVSQYLRVMGLDETKYPARVDIGFSSNLQPIIYEITTGFVDQVGSCLSLQQLTGDNTGLEALSQSPFLSSILTSDPYKPEYDVMRKMFEFSGKPLQDGESESTFVYGYPKDYMREKNNFIPGWKGLSSEEKTSQSKVLAKLVAGTQYIIPRTFTLSDTEYDSLPDIKDTNLVFKQNTPKLKGQRNTVVFGKGRLVQERYESGDMLAQEYIPPFRDKFQRRFEAKILFMPSKLGTSFTGIYNLVDQKPQSGNFSNTNIPNDGYPQGPGIIIS